MPHRLNSASPSVGARHVSVVGAGIAGLACALAAARSGASVRVFEQSPTAPSLPAHVEVVPSMLRDLVGLGLGDACIRAGFAFHGVDVMGRQGQTMLRLPTEHLAGRSYPASLGITHDNLFRILEQAAIAHEVAVQWGAEVVEIAAPRGVLPSVRLASGAQIESDLVVLAAGAGSRLRDAVFPGAPPVSDTGQTGWYTLVARPLDLNRPCIVTGAAGQRVVLVPAGSDVAGLAWLGPAHAPGAIDESAPRHLRQALKRFEPRIQALARLIVDGTPIVRRCVLSALLPAPWHRETVVAVGACAHALPPQFGQGAAQSVEDAVVLGELLSTHKDPAKLAEAFSERRIERVRRIHDLVATAARWDREPDRAHDLGKLIASMAQIVAPAA